MVARNVDLADIAVFAWIPVELEIHPFLLFNKQTSKAKSKIQALQIGAIYMSEPHIRCHNLVFLVLEIIVIMKIKNKFKVEGSSSLQCLRSVRVSGQCSNLFYDCRLGLA